MLRAARPAKVLFYQSAGFLVIIGVCLFDEISGLSGLILGNQPYISDFRGSVLKILLIFAVWLLVSRSTTRILAHMRYLEELTKVCAWCRRIEHQGNWMRLEEYFKKSFDTPTTHGICQECLQKTRQEATASPETELEEHQHSDPMESHSDVSSTRS
jgi:hypothetical protein